MRRKDVNLKKHNAKTALWWADHFDDRATALINQAREFQLKAQRYRAHAKRVAAVEDAMPSPAIVKEQQEFEDFVRALS